MILPFPSDILYEKDIRMQCNILLIRFMDEYRQNGFCPFQILI